MMKLKKGLENCKEIYSGHMRFLERVESDLQINESDSYVSNNLDSEFLGERALNYEKIKKLLIKTKDPKQICAMLEALRWRVSRSQSVLEKRENCLLLISNNLLETKVTRWLLESGQPNVLEHLLALINALAGDYKGRSYLEKRPELTQVLIEILMKDGLSSYTNRVTLFILQKLSLRKTIQNLLIQNRVIVWAVKRLCDKLDSMPVYW